MQINDPEIVSAMSAEFNRQFYSIELIASENIVSQQVMLTQGSVLTNKYAEGYPGKRFYGGCEHVDVVEALAIERAKRLFGCAYANVQPHSGSQANQAVFLALLKPGDTILGMSLNSGGHLTHGAAPNQSGKWFRSVQYEVDPTTMLLDYDAIRSLAYQCRPKLIIAGGSAYARSIDFDRFAEIAKEVGAYLMVDMAHIAGLVAGGMHASPFPAADVVTSTTHKTLRGPRGGIILTNRPDIAKAIDSAVFPGLQGGPLMHVIAAKAVAFGEALLPSFKEYAQRVVDNAQALSNRLMSHGYDIVTGGTDNHIVLVDLRAKGMTGKAASINLEKVGITCNKNAIPFDTMSPMITSGIRLGTPACTTRGFGIPEFETVADLIDKTLRGEVTAEVTNAVRSLCEAHPIYR